MPPSSRQTGSRLTGSLVVSAGLLVAAFAVGRLRALPPTPLPLLVTLFTVALLFVVLGLGVWRRARAAWSYAVALTGVTAFVVLLGTPALLRSGIPIWAALAAVAFSGIVVALLIVDKPGA